MFVVGADVASRGEWPVLASICSLNDVLVGRMRQKCCSGRHTKEVHSDGAAAEGFNFVTTSWSRAGDDWWWVIEDSREPGGMESKAICGIIMLY